MLEVRVRAEDPAPDRFRWEIVDLGSQRVVERAAVSFRRENTAHEAGRRMLARLLHDYASRGRA